MKEFTSQQVQNQRQLLKRSQTILDGGTQSVFADKTESDNELRKHLNSIRTMSFTIAHKNISNRNIGYGSEPLHRRPSSHYKSGSDGSRLSRQRSSSPGHKTCPSGCSSSEPGTSSTEDEAIVQRPVLNIRRGKDIF